MKKLLFSLILCFLCNNIFAQETEAYRTFLGLPIEGNGEIFANKLVEKGFQITGRNDDEGKIFLSGKYDNLDCNIELSHIAHLNIIGSLQINFVTDTISIAPQERAIFKEIYSTSITPYQDQGGYEILGIIEDIAQIDTLEMAFTTLSKRSSEEFTFPSFSIGLSPKEFSISYFNADLFNQVSNYTANYFKTRDTYYFKVFQLRVTQKPLHKS